MKDKEATDFVAYLDWIKGVELRSWTAQANSVCKICEQCDQDFVGQPDTALCKSCEYNLRIDE